MTIIMSLQVYLKQAKRRRNDDDDDHDDDDSVYTGLRAAG